MSKPVVQAPYIGTPGVDLKPVVQLIENIFSSVDEDGASKGTPAVTSLYGGSRDMPQAILDDIRMISCEMSCNHSGGVEKTAPELLKRLKNYSWNAQVVLVVAAFAMTFGEFWLLVCRRTVNDPLAQSVALLKGQSMIPKPADRTALNKLLKALMDAVKTSFAFFELSLSSISKAQEQSLKADMEYFRSASDQIIRSVVHFRSILGKNEDEIESIMSSFEAHLSKINSNLPKYFEYYKKVIGETKKQAFEEIQNFFGKKNQSEIVAYFMGCSVDKVPENLRNKHVLFLISDVEISIEVINVLKLYSKNTTDYEIIWLPIMDESAHTQKKFSDLKSNVTWNVVLDHSKVGQVINRWINFIKYPIALSFSSLGEMTSPNALPSLLTWGNAAFPFTADIEWQGSEIDGWRLDLLVTKQIDQKILSWSQSAETFVCLFGGQNTAWIRELTAKVKEATGAPRIFLKMAYVGRNIGKGLDRKELSHPDIHVVEGEPRRLFWSRLESVLLEKIQLGTGCKTNRVMREAMKILNYDGSGGEWAIFSMGSNGMVTTNGETALAIMSKYKDWNKDPERLKNYMTTLPEVHGTPICPVCSQEMGMY